MASRKFASAKLDKAVAEAQRRGWSTCNMSLDSVRVAVELQGIGVPTRRGRPLIDTLTPRAPDKAYKRSLSGMYGLGAFPLHTDGAHLRTPPDFTLLEAPTGSDVPTLLFDLHTATRDAEIDHALRNGVFSVGAGASSFYAHAVDDQWQVRFDPGCMFPVDPPARLVADWMAGLAVSTVEHLWEPGEALVLSNRRCLHGRPDVAENPDRALRRLMIHWDR